MLQNRVVLLLGSNLGNPKKNIQEAISMIDREINKVLKISEFLETKPVEFVSCNIFCNIALSIETGMSPIELLKKIKEIEMKMGRIYDSTALGGYQDRVIDIDIVMMGELKFESSTLTIPHRKHMYERDFSIKLIRQVI